MGINDAGTVVQAAIGAVIRTQVCITVDTEFSIAGAFADANRQPVAEPIVWCHVEGRSEGLAFLLDCFRKYAIDATFFVETLQRIYFRHDPMQTIAQHLAKEGHEVQLHAHPCWSIFRHPDWVERVRCQPRQDDFFGRSEDDTFALIQHGIDTFSSWGLPRPKVFRSGSLQHDDALYRALARAGIRYSFSIGLSIFDSGDPRYQLYAGCHERHGILGCPVLTFNDWSVGGHRHLKTLTIAGTSFAETRCLLLHAHAIEIPMVVILTHPFEFIQSRDASLLHARRHAVNQGRLVKLCQFLQANQKRFVASGMASAVDAMGAKASPQNPLIRGTRWHSLRRMATQVAYERFGRLVLAMDRAASP